MLQMAWSISLWNRLNQPTTGFEIWGSLLVAGILGLLAIISVYFRIIMIIANIAYFALIVVAHHYGVGISLYLSMEGINVMGAAYVSDIKILLLMILFISTFAINATIGILLQSKAKI